MTSLPLPLLDRPRPPAAVPRADDGPRSIGAVRVLRVSLTDRCNYRCLYCMPEEGVRWLPGDHLLTNAEVRDVVRAAVDVHGICRFKLTGGEPTLRPGLVELVAMLRAVPGVEDLSLTTNGQLLAAMARPLKAAGLDRVTVSVDSLRPDRFRRITRTGDLAAVLRGLDAAEAADLASLKVNCVVMRGTNDDEVADFAALSVDRRVTVRFIEYMPLGDAAVLRADRPVPGGGPAGGCGAQDRGVDVLVPEAEVRRSIEARHGPLLPIERAAEAGVGPATVWRIARGSPAGRVGFISAMSAPFCATCNRLRLTADGVLRSCLFDGGEVAVRQLLREQTDDAERRRQLGQAMERCVALKPSVHGGRGAEQMSRIGG